MAYYKINDKLYYINVENLFKMVGELPLKEKLVNTTITQYYGNDDDDTIEDDDFIEIRQINGGKEIVETKSNANETMSSVRYDFMRGLINTLFDTRYSSNGVPVSVDDITELTMAQRIAFNTLIEYKILMEVDTDE